MAVAYYALCTLADVKTRLSISGSGEDTMLEEIIDACTDAIERRCKRRFFSKDAEGAAVEYTEYHDSKGQNKIVTKQYPVNSVTSIHCDSERSYGADMLIDSGDYVVKSWGVALDVRLGSRQATVANAIKIVYKAGYATIPNDLAEACIGWASFIYQRKQNISVQSDSYGEDGVNNTWERNIPPFVARLIAPYRNMRI